MKIPFIDFQAHHASHREEIRRAIDSVIDSGSFAGGPFVEAFEIDFAKYCGTRHAIAVGSGTEALWLAMLAAGIGAGDEVITSPMSFFATVEAIHFTGAKPVFVDIDPDTYTMDPAALEGAVTSRTKAIIPVQLFGQAADMDPIVKFARERGVLVIEDAAQAHGARYKNKRVGSIGDAGCFSFYPGKNLGALGEGGAVVTDNDELACKVRMLRDHGQTRKSEHLRVGWNSRMDGIQGAVLRVKLRHLDAANQRRRDHAAFYQSYFSELEQLVVLPKVRRNAEHVYHIFAIQVPDRQELINSFETKGIGYGIHYPKPIHLQPALSNFGFRQGQFPVSERCADRVISLPIFPEMIRTQLEMVAGAVKEVCDELQTA